MILNICVYTSIDCYRRRSVVKCVMVRRRLFGMMRSLHCRVHKMKFHGASPRLAFISLFLLRFAWVHVSWRGPTKSILSRGKFVRSLSKAVHFLDHKLEGQLFLAVVRSSLHQTQILRNPRDDLKYIRRFIPPSPTILDIRYTTLQLYM